MDKKTENVKNEKVVFYAPLPVNKPYPIIRPSEKIQLQPTVNPVAIVPYLSAGEEEETVAQSAAERQTVAARKTEKRASARVSGVLMFIIATLSIILFGLSFAAKYPIAGAEKYISLKYFADMFDVMLKTHEFAKFDVVFAPYLIAVAYVAIAVNFILSIIAISTGKRIGFTPCAVIAFLCFVVAAFYEMKFFSQIKNLGNLLSRDCGWPSVMLIIIGGANLVFAFVCNIICPKHRIQETVEF